MSGASTGMVLDRALTPVLLDTALRVGSGSHGGGDARRLLTVALRDHVSAQEAEGKTKKCLSRMWVAPPAPAKELVLWAWEHQDLDPERSVLHLGALLATFPFAGLVCALVGRQLHLDGVVEPRRVRSQACAVLGDRSTIDIGARKVVTTLRYLGLLDGPNGRPLSAGRQPPVRPELTGWLAHALLLTRQTTAIGTDELPRAFELATLKVPSGVPGGYPLIETFSEGSRSVVVER
jgi:hypothetical protein